MTNEESPGELVAVFRTADASLIPLLKSVLEAADIPFVVQGDQATGMLPLGPFGSGLLKRVLGAAILVPADQADEARALLETHVAEEIPDEEGQDR